MVFEGQELTHCEPNITADDYRSLGVGEDVKVGYHVESVLGTFRRRFVLESINSYPACGSSLTFSGGLFQKVFYIITVVVRLFPLGYLVYVRRNEPRNE